MPLGRDGSTFDSPDSRLPVDCSAVFVSEMFGDLFYHHIPVFLVLHPSGYEDTYNNQYEEKGNVRKCVARRKSTAVSVHAALRWKDGAPVKGKTERKGIPERIQGRVHDTLFGDSLLRLPRNRPV